MIFTEALIVISSRGRVREGFASGLEDLAAANQGVVSETVLWRLGNPSFVSAPNAIAEEMRFGAEDTVEVDGDGHVALRRSQRRKKSGGGGRMVGEGGRFGEELEVGDEAVGPFAGGAGGGEAELVVGF